MKLNDLLLKKEELPILHDNCFYIPIHPRLLNPDFLIDEKIAHEVFPQVGKEWYEDLKKAVHSITDSETKSWIEQVFLTKKPKVIQRHGEQTLDSLSWSDKVTTASNGFATELSISRNAGGSLYLTDKNEAKFFAPIGGEYIRFSRRKLEEFAIESAKGKNFNGANILTYRAHNIDNLPGALFLRNWAIACMNEIFRRYMQI